jgi:predicted CoA-binding protein
MADDTSIEQTIKMVLESSRTIAVVGMSRRPGKPSHDVPALLIERGFDVIAVNPHATEILGVPSFATLEDIDRPVDLVDVFRPAPDTPPVARAAVAIGAKALWLQLGIASEESRKIALEAGLSYVEDRCIAVETRRLAIEKRAS